jgi:hypothetical protein
VNQFPCLNIIGVFFKKKTETAELFSIQFYNMT